MKKLLLKSLLALFLFATASAANAQTFYYQQNFSSGALPSGWSNDSLGQPGVHLWVFNNPFTRVVTGAGFDANFAIFDSDEGSSNDNTDENASLTTPSINISAATTNLYLELDEQYRALGGPGSDGSIHWIEASTDGGSTWNNVVYDSANVGYPTAIHSSYDLTSYVGNANLWIRFHYTGNWDWWWAIDNVDIVSYPACVSAPNAGATSSSAGASVCDGVDFTLSLIGAASGPTISYQWQSSSDNINWLDISLATSPTRLVSQSTATYYRCNVTCSGLTAASTPVFVDMNAPNTCYCEATHFGGCTVGTGVITTMEILGTTLNNLSGCDELTAPSYTFWPPAGVTTANLTRGTAYDFNVTTDGDNIISIWIDFDQNGIFDITEWVQPCLTSVAGTPNTSNWMIPMAAAVGPTRMRVRARAAGNTNDESSSCLQFGSGESEDYIIGIEFNVGVNEMIQANGVSFFPNPTDGKLSVFFHENTAGTTIQLYDVLGNLVRTTKVESALRTDIDISALANGAYFAKVNNGKEIVTQKIILNK